MKDAIRRALPSVNEAAAPMMQSLIDDADRLRLIVHELDSGPVIVDAGIEAQGGLEAGRRIAEICMGGLGQVSVQVSQTFPRWPLHVTVHTANPVLACLGSQYAGWSLSGEASDKRFQAMGSGPARALAAKEPLFAELEYRDTAASACLVLEVDTHPPASVVEKVIRDCGISAERLRLILTPTTSLAGTVQIVARVLEVAMHKLHTLGFPLGQVIDGAGTAPLPPPGADFLNAMGRTNDAILFGGWVQLYVDCEDDDAEALANGLPSGNSRDYGKPFGETFREYKFDFYQIDPLLFAPAAALVTNLKTGNSFHAGMLDHVLLERSFGGRV